VNENLSTIFFVLAIIHTFLVSTFRRMAHRFRKGSPANNFFHLLGEVEVVFGLWAAAFFLLYSFLESAEKSIERLESTHFEEAVFVFVIMAMASSKPILDLTRYMMAQVSSYIPLPRARALTFAVVTLGPLLGSFITEPAAMTVSAFLLLPILSSPEVRTRSRYLLLGLLFVNVSIGGTLTHFAAPPVLVVARPWEWTTASVFSNIGWRAIVAVFISSVLVTSVIRRELDEVSVADPRRINGPKPIWNAYIHLGFIGLAVLSSHHITVLFALFLFFLGWVAVTAEHQNELNLRDALLVGFFLAGLMSLGNFQSWWIKPLLVSLPPQLLFWGATILTAISDNALLTYLGTLVPELTDTQKLGLVRGAVCGGGLTVIANAPNPIGFSVLGKAFGENGIHPLGLLLGAAIPTLIAAVLFNI
jgi:hypothetical protein